VRSLVRGDRLDSIAAEVYGDATKWRAIAEYNEISDPLGLKPGQRIIIPEL
jgi:nucleoid-associated protein YgaU